MAARSESARRVSDCVTALLRDQPFFGKDQSDPSTPSGDNSPQEQDEPGSGSGSAGPKPSGQMPASHDPCGTGEVMDADERRDDATGQSGESPLDTPAEEQAWDEAMHQAASLARAQGNAPGAVEETIRQAHRSILDWRSLLRRYMTDAARRDYSWSVPNRRFIDSGLYLPSMHSEGIDATQGAWVWKDAYEAAEAAMVLFIQRYGRLMRREAGAEPGSAAAMLAMLETLAALEPSQTRRSEEQLALQQFSTPLPLAYAALQAAAIRPGDIVLEPSAGTGMLAVMAECALGKHAGGALHLNEIATVRARLLAGLFEHAPVTRHNAESIADYLPGLRPTVVLMNPPFSASPGVQRIRHDADLRHLQSAFSMLPAGGRLVAITSAGCIPSDAAWSRAFERLDPPPRTVFSIAIDGRAYARRGTTFDTRLTVIDRDPANAQDVPIDARASVPTAAGLLAAIAANVPQRQAVVPIAAAPLPTSDLFGHAAARPAPRKRTTATASGVNSTVPHARDWGPVAELDYETPSADEQGTANEAWTRSGRAARSAPAALTGKSSRRAWRGRPATGTRGSPCNRFTPSLP